MQPQAQGHQQDSACRLTADSLLLDVLHHGLKVLLHIQVKNLACQGDDVTNSLSWHPKRLQISHLQQCNFEYGCLWAMSSATHFLDMELSAAALSNMLRCSSARDSSSSILLM